MAYLPPFNGGRLNASIGGNSTSAGGGYMLMSSGTMVLAGGNNITLSQNGNAVTISGANPAAASINFSAGANSASLAAVTFSNSNGVSFGLNGSTITASHNGITSQSNQALSASNGSFAYQTAGFSNANGVTFGTSAGSIMTASVNTSYAASNHSHGNPTLNLTNLSGTTASASNGLTLSLSAAAQTVQTQNLFNLTLTGNTAGAMAQVSSGTLSLAGGNNITLSQNGNAITISGGAGGGGIALANSQTTYTSGTANLVVAGGAMTIASTTGQSYNFSVPQTSSLSVTGALSMSTNGNTVSIGAPASSSMVATGGLLSISTSGSTISLGLPGLMSNWMHNSAAMYSSSTGNMINGTASIARMLIPNHLSFTRIDIPVSISGATSATANTAAMALSAVGVIYTRNGSTLNPIIGQSSTTTYSYASNSGVYSSITGARLLSFNLATSLSAGEYYFGLQLSSATSSVGTATTNLGWTVAPVYGTTYSAVPWSDMSAAQNQTVNLLQPLQGINSVAISNTTMTMQQSQISQSGGSSGGARGNFIVAFRNN